MRILPEEARANFEYTIDWLEAKACARKTGLGTPLPWDREWKVETLSDSTVYMAFYTLATHINQHNIPAESLSEKIFNFIFYGEGDAAKLGKKNKINEELLEEMRREFKYWMPVDFRNSAKELIPNHLTFFIFHHVALFPKEYWPRCISVNGMISIEGEKMSKSKGNFITLKNALRSYGASVTRAVLLYSSEGLRDPDWRAKAAADIQKQLVAFYNLAMHIIDMQEYRKERRSIDVWLIGRLQRNIKRATEEYEEMRTRSAFQVAFFDIWKDVRWYMRRDKPNREVLMQVLETWVKLISPYIPAFCEELWSKTNKKGFVSTAAWPSADESLISMEAEFCEELVEKTTGDVDNILEVTKIKPKKIVLYVAPHWKWEVLKILSRMEKPDIKEVMKNEGLRKRGSEVAKYVSELLKEKISFETEIDELKTLKDAREFFEKEFKCSIEVYSGEEEVYDPLNKRKQAMPMKPAIYVE
jgi:leucyl-tRNA synthetase